MPETRTTSETGASLCVPGRNCWRVERCGRAALVVDAADYFRLARQAMLDARSQILVMGWDFDSRIKLVADESDGDEAPVHLGPFLSWLAKRNPELRKRDRPFVAAVWHGPQVSDGQVAPAVFGVRGRGDGRRIRRPHR